MQGKFIWSKIKYYIYIWTTVLTTITLDQPKFIKTVIYLIIKQNGISPQKNNHTLDINFGILLNGKLMLSIIFLHLIWNWGTTPSTVNVMVSFPYVPKNTWTSMSVLNACAAVGALALTPWSLCSCTWLAPWDFVLLFIQPIVFF